jgi:hypothetical protein
VIYQGGDAALEQALGIAERLLQVGATVLELYPVHFVKSEQSLRDVREQMAWLKH